MRDLETNTEYTQNIQWYRTPISGDIFNSRSGRTKSQTNLQPYQCPLVVQQYKLYGPLGGSSYLIQVYQVHCQVADMLVIFPLSANVQPRKDVDQHAHPSNQVPTVGMINQNPHHR
jgi:hypothetical protein